MTLLHNRLQVMLRPALLMLAFAFLVASGSAHAQDSDVSIYVTSTTADYAFFNNITGSTTNYKGVSSGIGAGLTANFTRHSRTTLGLDIQGAADFGDTGGSFGAVSLRVGYVPRNVRLRPFIQAGGGLVSANERPQDYPGPYTTSIPRPTTSIRQTNGAFIASAGLDVRLSRVIDLRLFNIGIGTDGSTTLDRVGTGFVSSGLVIHLPRPHMNKR